MVRYTGYLFCCLIAWSAALAHAEIVPDLLLHARQSLDGSWRTIVDPYELGFYDYRYNQRDLSDNPNYSEAFYVDAKPRNASDRVEYDFDTSDTLQVPGDWNTQKPELFYYEGTVWYRTCFERPRLSGGERSFLRFGAANYRADVYLNGRKLGWHIGGFTPFSFEITDRLRDGENSLVVRVDNKRHKSGVPTLNTDWWNYGGITRSVQLVTTPASFIAEHRVHLDTDGGEQVVASVQIDGASEHQEVTLAIPELGVNTTATVDENGMATFRATPQGVVRWSPANPKLYDVTLSTAGDSVTDRIGFRTIEVDGKQLLLNGEPIFLRGVSIHEEYAADGGGRVKSPAEARQLLEWAKELNCNFVRLAHYPHNEAMTRLADEMGILVWSEVPVYWTIDWDNRETFANAANQLEEMIRRDANRASIVIWSLANETPTSEARLKFLTNLAAKARSLDSTRLLSAAMEKHGKRGAPDVSVVQDPLADVVDLLAFNQYTGWYDGLPEKCSRVTWEIPYDKPVFVSEFGGGAKYGLHGKKTDRWTEEFQADLYRQSMPMLDKIDGFVGCSPWVMVDFRSPRRVLPEIQDGFNRKGLMSEKGEKKQAYYVLQEYYRQKAQESE